MIHGLDHTSGYEENAANLLDAVGNIWRRSQTKGALQFIDACMEGVLQLCGTHVAVLCVRLVMTNNWRMMNESEISQKYDGLFPCVYSLRSGQTVLQMREWISGGNVGWQFWTGPYYAGRGGLKYLCRECAPTEEAACPRVKLHTDLQRSGQRDRRRHHRPPAGGQMIRWLKHRE